jgi:hypothetical protein
MDMILDIVVSPDRSWLWKDEDEFEAMSLQACTPRQQS